MIHINNLRNRYRLISALSLVSLSVISGIQPSHAINAVKVSSKPAQVTIQISGLPAGVKAPIAVEGYHYNQSWDKAKSFTLKLSQAGRYEFRTWLSPFLAAGSVQPSRNSYVLNVKKGHSYRVIFRFDYLGYRNPAFAGASNGKYPSGSELGGTEFYGQVAGWASVTSGTADIFGQIVGDLAVSSSGSVILQGMVDGDVYVAGAIEIYGTVTGRIIRLPGSQVYVDPGAIVWG